MTGRRSPAPSKFPVSPVASGKSGRRARPLGFPRPFYLIAQLNMEVINRLERDMKPTGITPAVGRVLNAIATRPHISSSELARMFGIAPQSIKQSIQQLEDKGLIKRTTSRNDQRVLGAELTEAGWRARAGQQEALVKMYAEVFDILEPAELDELARLLIKVLLNARPSALEYYADLAQDVSRAKARKATG
ncbi:MarR family winged helix-turn-helix transcriptional regulator [Sphingomonas gilva]|nr:MarR family transcriptional regulator [Sphingomonas gilva]